jgi:hypothetical protein
LVLAEPENDIVKFAVPVPSASPFIVDEAPPEVLPLPSLINANAEVEVNAKSAIKVFIKFSLPDWTVVVKY